MTKTTFFGCLLWVGGIILIASDGAWFPFLNVIGLAIFYFGTALVQGTKI